MINVKIKKRTATLTATAATSFSKRSSGSGAVGVSVSKVQRITADEDSPMSPLFTGSLPDGMLGVWVKDVLVYDTADDMVSILGIGVLGKMMLGRGA